MILIGIGELFSTRTISGRKELPFNSYLYAKRLIIRETAADDSGRHIVHCCHCHDSWGPYPAGYISKKLPCARRTAFASGYQAQNIGAHDARCVLWLAATLSCARCIRRDCCHTQLHLDASSDTTFALVLPDAAHNIITPPDSPLILSAP